MTAPPVSTHPSRDYGARLRDLESLIGRTPLLELRCRLRGQVHLIYAKLESLNFTGSIKDRMALAILRDAFETGILAPGSVVAEATSGNTGLAFAALGRVLGHPVRIFMPDWMSQERKLLILGYGAEIVPVTREQGGFLGSIAMTEAYARENPQVFLPRQFENEANVRAHRDGTGPELLKQMERVGATPTAFVAGVGTGGTVMGVGAYLRRQVPECTIHPLEPSNSPTMRTGRCVGKHRIQGISDEFIPTIVDLKALDAIVDVDDGESIAMARRLASELGLSVGISSGANFLGALELAVRQGSTGCVATVFSDCSKKYLSTDLCCGNIPQCSGLAAEVELLDWRCIPA